MVIFKKIKNGFFVIKLGSFDDKSTSDDRTLVDYFNRNTPPNKKVERPFNIFIDHHLNNGYTRRELRLNRTAIEFG